MADPSLYTYPSPLAAYRNLPPLPMVLGQDGKSFLNSPSPRGKSVAYERFVDPLDTTGGGFDVHIYYFQDNAYLKHFAKELWERIRREFPELRIYKLWDGPVGPHPIAMFEVNIFTPAQFGAFIPWLVINRGPLSALIHPNTVDLLTGEEVDVERSHTQRATWMGDRLPLDLMLFKRLAKEKAERARQNFIVDG